MRSSRSIRVTEPHLGTITVPDTPWEVAATRDALWVTDRLGIQPAEIDPVAGQVVATRPVPGALPATCGTTETA